MGRPTHAARSRALSAPSTAVACGRPRRGAVAALVPRWSHGDDHLPGGRVTRALPPPAKGHGRGAWCKRRNRTAGGRWGPHLPGQPASRLHPHAVVRAAFDNVGSDRHGLWVRHADTHAQSNTPGARGLTVRRPPSIGRAEARHGRDSRATRALAAVESTSSQVGFDQSDWSNPTHWAPSRRFSRADSTAPGSTRTVERAQAGSTRSVEWALGAVDSARGGGRLGAARR